MIGIPQYIERFQEKNNAKDCTDKHVVIIGGTRGLGAAAAEKFAKLGASVTFVGRSQKAGDIVLRNCRANSPLAAKATFNHVLGNLSLLSEAAQVADQLDTAIAQTHRGIDALVLTAGCYGSSSTYSILGGTVKTQEQLDQWFSLLFLSRFLVIQRLMPWLKQRPGSRVINILRAGSRGSLDIDNLGMDGKSNLETISSMGLYLDATTLSLAERHHEQAFYHITAGPMVPHPVVEDTEHFPLLAWVERTLRPWLYSQSVSAYDAAEAVVYLAIQPEFGPAHSGTLMSERLENLPLTEFMRSPDTHDRIWRYALNEISLKLPNEVAKFRYASLDGDDLTNEIQITHEMYSQ
ncbi:hypothetical protein EC988_004236 [Linderina pennispora]|nr:hypothetical protein EC988_004236 [Linderina pennispora]